MKWQTTTLLLLALLPVSAQAYHLSTLPNPGPDDVHDTRNRVLATQTSNLDNAAAGILLNYTFPWDPEYSFDDIGHTIRIHIAYTAIFPSSSNGAWNVSVASEKGNLTSCAIRVETIDPVGLTLDALLVYAHYSWDCFFTVSTNTHPHNHTVWVNRTSLSGTPAAMTGETVAVRIETEDVVFLPNTHLNLTEHRTNSLELNGMDFDGLSFGEVTLYFAWLFALVWSLRNAKLMCAAAATIGLACTMIGGTELIGLVGILFFALALWLEATAREQLYARFFKQQGQ